MELFFSQVLTELAWFALEGERFAVYSQAAGLAAREKPSPAGCRELLFSCRCENAEEESWVAPGSVSVTFFIGSGCEEGASGGA